MWNLPFSATFCVVLKKKTLLMYPFSEYKQWPQQPLKWDTVHLCLWSQTSTEQHNVIRVTIPRSQDTEFLNSFQAAAVMKSSELRKEINEWIKKRQFPSRLFLTVTFLFFYCKFVAQLLRATHENDGWMRKKMFLCFSF